MDIGDVDGETIERAGLKDKSFERFFKGLLKSERELRHRPDADIAGPVADYHGDEKRDLEFVVHGPPTLPRTQFTAALTWDALGRTWYSCKGGSSWRSSILGELGQAAYNKFIKENKKPGPRVKKRPPPKLLEHIEGGGRYVFVTSVSTIDDGGLLDAVTKQLTFWLEQDGLTVPSGLRGQLEFIDANRLGDFISTHRPTLSEDYRRALGLVEPAGLRSWEQWTDELGTGRDLPAFEVNAERQALFDAIADTSKDVLRVFGPPGVGKTRVVHEGIRRCGADAINRTRYSDDVDVNLRAVQDDWLRRGGTPWLVLDELRSVDVDQVIAKFRANAAPGARLFLIGISDAQARTIPGSAYELQELGEVETINLIRSENEALSDAQVQAIWHLSEGYPWYTVLLTQGVTVGDATLERGHDDATRWAYGTQRVLAGNPQRWESTAAWEREAELRAKTLLVAMLTRDVELEWDELCERYGGGLRLAIDEANNWDEVVRRERTCRHRQLLRQSGLRATRRYVSPNNLARLILHHFLTDPDLGPKIRRHAPEFRHTLTQVAKSVRVKPALIKGLARSEWDELQRRARDEGLEAVETYSRSGEPMYEAARDLPEYAGRSLARLLISMSPQVLVAAGNLRAVARGVLEHVIHRAISAEVFLEAEHALLILAGHEDSPFVNNARGIWRSLFLPGLHQTHQTWELRLGRLDARLSDPAHDVRSWAIDALAHAVDPREQSLGTSEDERADGEWPMPTEAELRERKQQLWGRLVQACEDPDAELASEAQLASARRVRSSVGRGLFTEELVRLSDQVPSWSPGPRRELLENIADLRRYDLDDFEELPELLAALEQLERAVAPMDLRERVRAQIGSWHPGPWELDDPEQPAHLAALDLDLALALLEDPDSLGWALDWSKSEEARRARALWSALGRADRGQGLHVRLVERVEAGDLPAVCLADYMLGWAEVDGAEAVEAWSDGLEARPSRAQAEARVRFLVFQTPTRARLDKICGQLRLGTIPLDALRFVPFRGWVDELEPDALVIFIELLAERSEFDEVTLASGLKLLERELRTVQREQVLAVLADVLRRCLDARVAVGVQRLVERAGAVFAAAGHHEFVVELITRALAMEARGGSNVGLGHRLVQKLFAKGHAEALWPGLARALLDDQTSISSWQLAQERLLAHVSLAQVLDWVGDDRRRAVVVASLTNPHAVPLQPAVCELLERFGGEGEVAARLTSRALSTPGVIRGGMVKFERRQLENARAWQRDASVNVESWARNIESILSERIDEHDARQELRAKYG